MTSKERRKPNGRVRKININGELFTRKLTLRYFFCYYYILYYIIFCYCYYYQEKRYLLKENLHFLYHGIPDFDIVWGDILVRFFVGEPRSLAPLLTQVRALPLTANRKCGITPFHVMRRSLRRNRIFPANTMGIRRSRTLRLPLWEGEFPESCFECWLGDVLRGALPCSAHKSAVRRRRVVWLLSDSASRWHASERRAGPPAPAHPRGPPYTGTCPDLPQAATPWDSPPLPKYEPRRKSVPLGWWMTSD